MPVYNHERQSSTILGCSCFALLLFVTVTYAYCSLNLFLCLYDSLLCLHAFDADFA